MERIEIVKGPVSSLYGRNGFAGAINYVPKKAVFGDTFGSIEGTIGSDERYAARASVNVPLGNNLALRLAGGYDTFDGTVKNVLNPGNNVGGLESTAFAWDLQGKLMDDRLRFDLFGVYIDDTRENQPVIAFNNNCGRASLASVVGGRLVYIPHPLDPRPGFFCGEVPAFDPVAVDPRGVGNMREGWITGWNLSYDFDWATATFQGGFVALNQTVIADRDLTTDPRGSLYSIRRQLVPGAPVFAPAFPAPPVRTQFLRSFVGNGPDETEDWNLEFRLASKQDQRLRWMGGVSRYIHYFEQAITVGIDTTSGPVLPEFPTGSSNFIFLVPGTLRPFNGELVKVTNSYVMDLGNAAFGSVDFDITDKLTAGVQLRWDQMQRKQLNRATNPRARQWREDKYWTVRANLDYKFADGQMVYGSVAKGVLDGFFNGVFDNFAGRPVPLELQNYAPSTSWNYEIGAKTSWLDNRLQANVALFYIDYTDLQISSAPPAPLITAIVANAAKATSKGLELQLAAALTENLSAEIGYGYNKPTFGKGSVDSGLDRFCVAGLCDSNVEGKLLTRTSQHTLSASATWADDLVGDWSYFLRADVRYQSKQFTRSNNLQWIPGRTLVNARLGFLRGDNLEISLWGKNLFDKKFPSVAIAQPQFNDEFALFITNTATGERRTWGLTAKYSF
jgi:iron complex outermembrane receptor protein